MTDREIDELEDRVPDIALAALDAASASACAANVSRVVVIDGGLYRISTSGEKELIRELPPWTPARDLANGNGK